MNSAGRISDESIAISLVILSYNSGEYLPACLESIERSETRVEVLIVDNASKDDSFKVAQAFAAKSLFPARVLPLKDNLGCAGGNNVGWRSARGEVVIFLNPDTEITPTFVREISAPVLNGQAAIAGGKIYYPNSRILQHAGGIIHPNGMTEHYGTGEEDHGQYDLPREVAYVTGAGVAISRKLLEELDGFDEDYSPAYYEETDLCTRARRRGYSVVYVPTAVMYHYESVSLEAASPAFLRMYNRMRIRYCLKNLSAHQWLTEWLPFESRWLRLPISKGNRKRQIPAYLDGVAWLLRKTVGAVRSRRRD